ncbi:RNA polymerase sigma factor [Ruminococcus flavefaciens]|uniref:RNA polymerase sigma factor n=1 Tax=Ruminococcus flavefaciens TaxID=1265 RepID=UPI0026EB8BF3|nr:RNA polymerase sigma factor [Ruminococcus flavefaciens]
MDNGASSYRRFLDGDRNSFTELVREYWDGLTLYLSGFTNSITEAEEFAEEVFLKLYAERPPFSGKSSFKTWLYAIGRNTVLNMLRKRRKIREASLDGFYDVSDKEDIERNHIHDENKKLLYGAIEDLHSDYRQVLYLVYFENFGVAETAEIMHKSERQVYNLLYRAKAALKKTLEKEGFEYEEL